MASASAAHRPATNLQEGKASFIFHLRSSAPFTAIPSFWGPILCPSAVRSPWTKGDTQILSRQSLCPKLPPPPCAVMGSGPSLSPPPTFHPFPRATGTLLPSCPPHPIPARSPLPPRDLVLHLPQTQWHQQISMGVGVGGAHLKSLQADLGQDQGFSSMKRTSEIRELLFIFSLHQQSDGHLPFFLPPCRTE